MISTNDQRVLFYDDSIGSFTDISIDVNDYADGESYDLTFDTGDKLYFGSYLPFNHKYFDFSVPNIVAVSPTIEVWDGTQWVSVVDILDYTDEAGASFGKSGIIQFTKDYDTPWHRVNRTTEAGSPTEFSSGPDIFWKYWARMSFDDNPVFSLNYVGNLFCGESDLFAEYPSLNQSVLLNSWKVGKTTWLDQRVVATEFIVTDLKRRNIITERSQVIELATLTYAAVHKTANIIYSGLGPRNYAEEIDLSGKRYIDAMNQNKFEQDSNASSIKETYESNVTSRRATR